MHHRSRWLVLVARLLDPIIALPLYIAALLMKLVRRTGVHRLPFCRGVLLQVGVFPIRNHYYEPLFDTRSLPTIEPRPLPGINFDADGQLRGLTRLQFGDEFRSELPKWSTNPPFQFGNGQFESGDAEFWYALIRAFKPRRIFEIGSGHSTLVARHAIEMNHRDDPSYQCRHVCVEPYEAPWLRSSGAEVIRDRVENLGTEFFGELAQNDVLFIDSSHVIRPQGDVLFEFIDLLPTLRKGVIVHVHDIFSPRDYPPEWIKDEVRLWNEQYLLEAFLTQNSEWKVIGALNFLRHEHYDALRAVCPFLTNDREPGSFYMQRVSAAEPAQPS